VVSGYSWGSDNGRFRRLGYSVNKYWRIKSREVGIGPLHETKQEAEDERKEFLKDDPTDEVTLHSMNMSKTAYEKLPEHEGY